HTKMHGCVKAEFIVEPDLPANLKVGVFSEAKTYHAWVRFSNASTVPKPDKKKDVRGAAIKLMNVPGEKILNDEALQKTQDFLLMSSETFFSKNVKEFSKLLSAATSKNKLKLLLYFLNPMHLPLLKRFGKTNIPCSNPLNIPYWSTQPYQFGNTSTAVKYLLKPSADNKIVIEDLTDKNYLRYNLAQTLNNNTAAFDFYIQFQTNADTMPIEDPTIPWDSQYVKVATLKIPAQQFDAKEQMDFGDNLSFNPWHTLPAHRPLGSFNRVRKRIYEALSNFRHVANNLPVFEPQDSDDFLANTKSYIPKTIESPVPSEKILTETSEVIVHCAKEDAFKFISSNNELPLWLKKSGPIAQAKTVEIIKGPYNFVGAQRKVIFDNGDNITEELMSFNMYANYSYRIAQFSDFLKHLTNAAYSQFWFDTVKDKTRIRWVYSFTYKNFLGRIVLSLFLLFVYKKWMKNSLKNAKGVLEDGAS
ncbi:MAG: hypothetical protein H7Y00_12620, partial [Fimbriimonadaceae bacterium]|nr:hypothetical protein [Chitinophagales bacterium]